MRHLIPATAFFLGAISSHVLLTIAPPAFAADLVQPLVVATNWGSYGVVAFALFVCTLLVANLGGGGERIGWTLFTSALALGAGLFFTPVFSSDVYAYAAYGHMANTGMNPYAHTVLPKGDALFAAAMWQWTPLPICAYGPAFVLVARTVDVVTNASGAAIELNVLRIVACCGLLLAGYFASLDADAREGTRRAALLVLNPVALWSAIEGHNDTLMLACVLGGFALHRRNPFAGAVIAALGGLIKVPALAAAGALGIDAAARRRATAATIAGAGTGIVLAIVGIIPWIRGITAGTLVHGHYAPQASFQTLAGPWIAIAAAAALLVYAYGVWRVDAPSGWAVAAVATWLLIPNPYPWYGLWLLGIGIYARNPRVRRTILFLVWASLVRYIPDAIGPLTPTWNAVLGIVATLPLVLLWL